MTTNSINSSPSMGILSQQLTLIEKSLDPDDAKNGLDDISRIALISILEDMLIDIQNVELKELAQDLSKSESNLSSIEKIKTV